ncbi:hypothetical protein B0H34DRAFT_800169 [Crassisporium funariophilum]|nr:hypothetical protein B0H34DRAFT_800169 [Crassisporium funariophilum]
MSSGMAANCKFTLPLPYCPLAQPFPALPIGVSPSIVRSVKSLQKKRPPAVEPCLPLTKGGYEDEDDNEQSPLLANVAYRVPLELAARPDRPRVLYEIEWKNPVKSLQQTRPLVVEPCLRLTKSGYEEDNEDRTTHPFLALPDAPHQLQPSISLLPEALNDGGERQLGGGGFAPATTLDRSLFRALERRQGTTAQAVMDSHQIQPSIALFSEPLNDGRERLRRR